jgi:nucleotide-binding universal stress UspA family protein
MKKILVLTDFSEASRNALAFARSFFSDTLADFHLVNVLPSHADSFNGVKHTAESDRSEATRQLQAIVTELRLQAANDWHTFRSTTKSGKPLDIVEQIVREEPYDFVVIGPVTASVNELFGNNAIALIHRLKANVLVVPTTARIKPVYQVVLAIDFASLKNSKLLSPLKELVTLKGALLTLLSIETPDKKIIYPEQEIHIRQFLAPVKPEVAHLQALSPKDGIDAYLAGHVVDLLVTIPHFKGVASTLPAQHHPRTQAYTPLVPLLTLYDDGGDDLPELVDELSNANATL